MKKALCILLVAAILLGAVGCGAKANPNAGVYKARWATVDGISVSAKQFYENGFSIELKEGDRAVLSLDGNDYNLKWELDDTIVRIIAADTTFYGSLSDGVMTLVNFQDTDMDFTLVCDELVKTTPQTEYWNGHWYGWRIIYSGWGDYATSEDMAEDVFADIEIAGDKGYINVWGFDQTENEPLINASVKLEDGAGEFGKLVVQEGYAYGMLLGIGDLEIDPAASTVKSLDHMIEIAGIIIDPENEENGFEYHMFLRPWGMTWEDVATAESEDFLYADMMPTNYDDWYLVEIGVLDAPVEDPDSDEDYEEFDLDDFLEEFDMELSDEDLEEIEIDPETDDTEVP